MRIAIVGSTSGQSSYFGVGKTYYEYIEELGGTAIIIPATNDKEYIKDIIEKSDMLILPGGADLSAHLYGERPHVWNTNPDVNKEHFFVNHLQSFIDARVPVFGICLGFQMLNVKFGGNLTQHINSGLHQQDRRYHEAHQVRTIGKATERFGVNSHHHQAVKFKNMSDEMIALTYSDNWDKEVKHAHDENSIVESFIHRTLPIAGVQWHPEEWFDTHSTALIREVKRRGDLARGKSVAKEIETVN